MRRIVETFPYDVADHLRTPQEMAAYLDAWLSEAPDDTTGIARALTDIARAKCGSGLSRDNPKPPYAPTLWERLTRHSSVKSQPRSN